MEAHATPFTYSEAKLTSCATHLIHKSPLGRNDCHHLFLEHAAHYHRPPLTEQEEKFWGGNGGEVEVAIPSKRLEAFLDNVKFVYNHNYNVEDGRHTVGLNRFSDLSLEELPLMKKSSTNEDAESKQHSDWLKELESLSRNAFIHLDSEELIMQHAEKFQRKTTVQQHQQSKQHQHSQPYISLFQQMSSLFHKQSFFQGIFDSWWWIGERHDKAEGPSQKTAASIEEHSHHSISHSHQSKATQGKSFVVDKKNEMDGIEDNADRWDRYLNWATGDNPDGVGIVHEAMDQGLCGSCWAVSALGSMEASIVRNMAYMAYEETYKHTPSSDFHTKSELRTISISTAQDIELRSLQTADLSVQELVDCDTRYDQGCSGGNPLLAFYFLHRFGVTSSSNYPYNGKQNTCNYHKVDKPIATVETWGILTPDHENNMEKVLRYIGPVAVGLVGADPSFLAYKGGIFSVKGGKCEVGEADHAMLIVGYGEEENKNGSKTKYWIARNSWGTGWGENGYIRIERIGGRKGSRGVCEIARSPSVALGGMFTKDVELDVNERDLHRHGIKKRIGNNFSISTESSRISSALHRIRARLGFVQKGIMMATLNGSEDDAKSSEAMPLSKIFGVMSLMCLLTYVYRKHRRMHLRHHERTQNVNETNTVATNLSIVTVCSGAPGQRQRHHHVEQIGEDTALLNGCSGRVAYS